MTACRRSCFTLAGTAFPYMAWAVTALGGLWDSKSHTQPRSRFLEVNPPPT